MMLQKNIKEHNQNWPPILNHSYRILVIGGSGFGKTNLLLNLVGHQTNIDKIYLYAKDTYEAKYQLLISKRKVTRLRHLNDSKAFIEFSNDTNDICKNIEEYNLNKRCKIMMIFDDMIADMPNKHFPCFNGAVFICCIKKYQTKLYTLFYYENCKQTRASTNYI